MKNRDRKFPKTGTENFQKPGQKIFKNRDRNFYPCFCLNFCPGFWKFSVPIFHNFGARWPTNLRSHGVKFGICMIRALKLGVYFFVDFFETKILENFDQNSWKFRWFGDPFWPLALQWFRCVVDHLLEAANRMGATLGTTMGPPLMFFHRNHNSRAPEEKCPKSTRSPTFHKKFLTYEVERRAERAIFSNDKYRLKRKFGGFLGIFC